MATTVPTKAEYQQHCREHLADFRRFLADLPDERWDEPSLCEGWQVRDVVGHLTIGRTMPLRTVLAKVAAGGFKMDAVVARESRTYGQAHSPDELRATFGEETQRPKERGLAGVQPPKAKLADNLTHLCDIAVPLGIDPGLPPERLAAALDSLVRIGFWKSKQRTKGLRLVADDIDWSYGDGLEVRGPAVALVLALGGRARGLEGLTGDGVALLQTRMAG